MGGKGLKTSGSSATLSVDENAKGGQPMNPDILYQWTAELAMQLPGLNSWQVTNLGLFSYGVIEAESSQQMQIARKVACGEQAASAEKRLRWFIANERLSLTRFFEEWTAWVLRCLKGPEVVLLVDETKLADRLAVMVVGVAFEGRCIPLAWRCYRANDASAYPAEGQVEMIARLLAIVKQGMPPHTAVLVLADRGIRTSPDLCQRVADLEWHYLFRVTKQSKIITADGDYPIYEQVTAGHTWAASGLIFKKRGRIPAHARAVWQDGYDEPWALVTNDAQLTGWQWSSSRVRCPDHMARLMLILVVAYGWILGLGSYAVHWHQARGLIRQADGQLRRQWSLFKEGLQFFTDYVAKHGVCLKPGFVSDKRLL